MNITAQHRSTKSILPDRATSLVGVTGVCALIAAVAACMWLPPLALQLPAFALVFAGHLALDSRCRSRAPRVRSVAGFLWAPAGRFRRIAADTALLAAKRYRFYPSHACRPMLVWVGWWNCRTFPGDPGATEYFFFERGGTRYAIPAKELVPAG